MRAYVAGQFDETEDIAKRRAYVESIEKMAHYMNRTKSATYTTYDQYETGAQKDVKGKSRVDLVTPEMILALGDVLEYGTRKYSARNWEKGIPLMTSYGAALRHMLQWASGIDTDAESNLDHIEQAFINIGMIVTQMRRGRADLDDRPEAHNEST